jgi:hypothetical protein
MTKEYSTVFHILLISLFVDGRLSVYLLVIVTNNDMIWMCKYLFESLVLNQYPEVGLLGHVVTLDLNFLNWGLNSGPCSW